MIGNGSNKLITTNKNAILLTIYYGDKGCSDIAAIESTCLKEAKLIFHGKLFTITLRYLALIYKVGFVADTQDNNVGVGHRPQLF